MNKHAHIYYSNRVILFFVLIALARFSCYIRCAGNCDYLDSWPLRGPFVVAANRIAQQNLQTTTWN